MDSRNSLNWLFFSIVALIPIASTLLLVMQMFSLGWFAAAIASLNPAQQMTILYRHALIEIIALVLSTMISYSTVAAIRKYANTHLLADRTGLLRSLKAVGLLYSAVIALTIVGAILEGTARVLV